MWGGGGIRERERALSCALAPPTSAQVSEQASQGNGAEESKRERKKAANEERESELVGGESKSASERAHTRHAQ